MNGVDPRPAAIERRLADVRRVIAVTGGKGGIGKSSVASLLALVLAREGVRTGLLDLDLTAPSDHLILGIDDRFPTEEFGVEPPCADGVHFMSVHYFLGDRAAPLRGGEVTQALSELLAITRWPALDVLVVDMPPGLGDVALDAARFVRRAEYLVVAGRSPLVLETVRRSLRLLHELRLPVLGVLENMRREGADDGNDPVATLARTFGVPHAGTLPWDESFEAALGEADRLLRTPLARALREVAASRAPELLSSRPDAPHGARSAE
ncbi:MAG: P-loop NTPase [Myxococcota bacterium]